MQVDVAAKSQTNGINYFATNKPSLEQLASTNRTQSAHLQALSQVCSVRVASRPQPARSAGLARGAGGGAT